MRRFVLERRKDVSGVSGTGIVAEGVEFTDGRVLIRWFGDHPSTVGWDELDDAMAIHGHGNLTRVVWLDPKPPRLPGPHTILYPDHSEVRCYCQIGQTHLYVEPWQTERVDCPGCTGDPADHPREQWVCQPCAQGEHDHCLDDPNLGVARMSCVCGCGLVTVEAPRPPGEYVPGDQVERLAGVTPDTETPTETTPGWERCGILADGYCAHVEHHWGTGGSVRIGRLP